MRHEETWKTQLGVWLASVGFIMLCACVGTSAASLPTAQQSLEACALSHLPALTSSCQDPHQLGHSPTVREAIVMVVNSCVAPTNASVASQTIRLLASQSELSIAQQALSEAFTNATGVAVDFEVVPFYVFASALQQTVGTPTATGAFDVFQMSPQYFGDGDASGALLDLSPLVVNDVALQWNDLPPVLRDKSMVYGGKVLGLPLAVSAAVLLYRQDLFDYYQLGPPPATWQQMIALATSFNGSTDPAGLAPGGVWGLCVNWDCYQSFWLRSIWADHMQAKGPQEGLYYDPVTMKPLVNNAAMRQALELAAQIRAINAPYNGPIAGGCGNNNVQFAQGQCLMTFNLPFDFKVISPAGSSSAVRGRLGTAPLPGSSQVLDRVGDKLVACSPSTCPFATSTSGASGAAAVWVNQPPHFIITTMSVNARSALAMQFYSYELVVQLVGPRAASPLVIQPNISLLPYRSRDFDVATWVAAGYDAGDTRRFMAVYAPLFLSQSANQNPALSLTTPGAAHYLAVLSSMAANASAGQDYSAIMKTAEAQLWAAVLAKPGGVMGARTAYLASIGHPWTADGPAAAPSPADSKDSARTIVSIALPVVVWSVLAAVFLLWVQRSRAPLALTMRRWLLARRGVTRAPCVGPATTLVVTDMQDSTTLWEALPADCMAAVLQQHDGIMRKAIAKHCGYEACTEGDSFIVAFSTAHDALRFAMDVQLNMLQAVWPSEVVAHPSCGEVHVLNHSFLLKLRQATGYSKPSPTSAPASPKELGGSSASPRVLRPSSSLPRAVPSSLGRTRSAEPFHSAPLAVEDADAAIETLESLGLGGSHSPRASRRSGGDAGFPLPVSSAAARPPTLCAVVSDSSPLPARSAYTIATAPAAPSRPGPPSPPLLPALQSSGLQALVVPDIDMDMSARSSWLSSRSQPVHHSDPLHASLGPLSPITCPSPSPSISSLDPDLPYDDLNASVVNSACNADLAKHSKPVVAGRTLLDAWREAWPACTSWEAGAITICRGPRVRIGLHSGLASVGERSFSPASNRTVYAGPFLSLAKAVNDAAHGGQVLMSDTTMTQLILNNKLEGARVFYQGQHMLGKLALPQHLYLALPAALVARKAHLPRPRTALTLLRDVSAAPLGKLGKLAVCVIEMAGCEELFAWDAELALACVADFESIALRLLSVDSQDGGYSLPRDDLAPAGRVTAVFACPAAARRWPLQCQLAMAEHPWDERLLGRLLCDGLFGGLPLTHPVHTPSPAAAELAPLPLARSLSMVDLTPGCNSSGGDGASSPPGPPLMNSSAAAVMRPRPPPLALLPRQDAFTTHSPAVCGDLGCAASPWVPHVPQGRTSTDLSEELPLPACVVSAAAGGLGSEGQLTRGPLMKAVVDFDVFEVSVAPATGQAVFRSRALKRVMAALHTARPGQVVHLAAAAFKPAPVLMGALNAGLGLQPWSPGALSARPGGGGAGPGDVHSPGPLPRRRSGLASRRSLGSFGRGWLGAIRRLSSEELTGF